MFNFEDFSLKHIILPVCIFPAVLKILFVLTPTCKFKHTGNYLGRKKNYKIYMDMDHVTNKHIEAAYVP